MSTPSQPVSSPMPSSPVPEEVRETLQFLRQENDANRTAIRVESEANRKLLLDTVKIVSIPVGILILVAGWMGFHSISDLKATLEAEARQSTRDEISRMQVEIRQKLTDQFQTPSLQQMVKQAAAESTKTAAEPLIKSEVATQVKSRVDAERPAITSAVNQQTQIAVKQMGSQIDSQVRSSVDAKVATSIDPVIRRIKDEADLQLIITRMNADDGQAFDSLLHGAPLPDASEQAAVNAALRSVVSAHQAPVFIQGREFIPPISHAEVLVRLNDPDPFSREAAVDTLVNPRDFTLLPKFVEMMTSDPSINVRCSAYRVFNNWTGQNFVCLNIAPTLEWWAKHREQYSPK
jgi:hypothetical protein